MVILELVVLELELVSGEVVLQPVLAVEGEGSKREDSRVLSARLRARLPPLRQRRRMCLRMMMKRTKGWAEEEPPRQSSNRLLLSR